jgi:hypothetical protein
MHARTGNTDAMDIAVGEYLRLGKSAPTAVKMYKIDAEVQTADKLIAIGEFLHEGIENKFKDVVMKIVKSESSDKNLDYFIAFEDKIKKSYPRSNKKRENILDKISQSAILGKHRVLKKHNFFTKVLRYFNI